MVHVRTHSRHILLAVSAVLLLISILTNVGCAKENKSNVTDENIAVTPLDACASGATYQGNAWDRTPYAQMNVVPYGSGMSGFQHNASNGFCGCPQGTQPMCDGSVGVVCVPGALLSSQANIAWYQQGANGIRFSGFGGYTAYGNIYEPQSAYPIPQYQQPYPPYYPQGHHHRQPRPVVQAVAPMNCATQIGQTCTVGTNSCGTQSYCRPLAPNQPIGVCSR